MIKKVRPEEPPWAGKGLPHLCWRDVADVLRCQLFQERGLACIVQSQEEDSHLLVWGTFQFTQD